MNWAVFGKDYSASRVENGLSQSQGGKQEDQLSCYCIAEVRGNGDQNLRNSSRDRQTNTRYILEGSLLWLIVELDQEVSQGKVALGITFILSRATI